MSNILTNLLKETSPFRLLRIVLTDFLALRLFCFNIRQHGRQIIYFKSHVDGRKFHYWRPHAAVRPQVVHRCSKHSKGLCVVLWVRYQSTQRRISSRSAKQWYIWEELFLTARHRLWVSVHAIWIQATQQFFNLTSADTASWQYNGDVDVTYRQNSADIYISNIC